MQRNPDLMLSMNISKSAFGVYKTIPYKEDEDIDCPEISINESESKHILTKY